MAQQDKQHFTLTWQGREIGVSYVPSWSNAMERIHGCALARLEVEADGRAPLPFTETGYRSHFLPAFEIDSEGGPVAYVRQWLDWAAKDPAWSGAQLALF